jgi:hypothetical protein
LSATATTPCDHERRAGDADDAEVGEPAVRDVDADAPVGPEREHEALRHPDVRERAGRLGARVMGKRAAEHDADDARAHDQRDGEPEGACVRVPLRAHAGRRRARPQERGIEGVVEEEEHVERAERVARDEQRGRRRLTFGNGGLAALRQANGGAEQREGAHQGEAPEEDAQRRREGDDARERGPRHLEPVRDHRVGEREDAGEHERERERNDDGQHRDVADPRARGDPLEAGDRGADAGRHLRDRRERGDHGLRQERAARAEREREEDEEREPGEHRAGGRVVGAARAHGGEETGDDREADRGAARVRGDGEGSGHEEKEERETEAAHREPVVAKKRDVDGNGDGGGGRELLPAERSGSRRRG